ncbi:MAG: pyridoxamine 5'-phosphate oxidase family protein [Methylocystaceae bacterium]
MDMKSCIEFAQKNGLAWIATVGGNQPRVRPIGLWFADASGFYFQTSGQKDFHQQLLKNPKIEAAFYAPGDGLGTVLRISGEVEFLDDPALKNQVIKDRPFLKQFGLSEDNPNLIIFRLARGTAHFWTMKDDLAPKKVIEF